MNTSPSELPSSGPLESYAMIGDCHTAALVSRVGSIDWLCLPRFDSPSCFSGLLGDASHGRWVLAPELHPKHSSRKYRAGTLILETTLTTETGSAVLIDFMEMESERPCLHRIVKGLQGNVSFVMELVLRFDYGIAVPWVRKTERGLRAIAGPDAVEVCTAVPLEGRNLRTYSRFNVRAEQVVTFSLVWYPSYTSPPRTVDPMSALSKTDEFWKHWIRQVGYRGPWRDAVERSLITLKALTFRPTGGLVAAVTTSLPEELGGQRNWDYRYCWLRDATFTLYSLFSAGYEQETLAWREWLLRAAAGSPEQLQIMYGVAGERTLSERTLDHLPGYERSKPVRVGNAAYQQFQIDVYGEILDSLYLHRTITQAPNEDAWLFERKLLAFLETSWQLPDHGIWEIRGPRQHFTHSKVMAWLAFDRAVRSAELWKLSGPVDQWKATRDAIRNEVLEKAFNPRLNSFVQCYGSDRVDASLLLLPQVGFVDPKDPTVLGTLQAVEKDLSMGHLLRRYQNESGVDGLSGSESAFLICSFWFVDSLILSGQMAKAERLFEYLISRRNDVGLLSEEYNVEQGRLIGNFPQAISHVALINSAFNFDSIGGPAFHRSVSAPPVS